MSGSRLGLGSLALGAALALLAPGLRADPSIWERAADRRAAESARLLGEARKLHSRYLLLLDQPDSAVRRRLYLGKVRALLEQGGAAQAESPELRYALARVYRALYLLEDDRGLLAQAIPLLEHVAAAGAAVKLRAAALYDLALCHAHLGRRTDEIATYDRALAIEPHPGHRSVVLANQAEAFMANGALERAMRGYREALATLPTIAMPRGVTTMWGLAVALDRSGDLDRALAQIGLARSYDPDDARIHDPDWFYVPAHDEHWYMALGHWQRARQHVGDERAAELRAAADRWRAYLEHAPLSDRYAALGEQRLGQCERELDRALGRFAPVRTRPAKR